jgi:hypothetical protein
MANAAALLALLRDALRDRRRLLIENAALRHQVYASGDPVRPGA